MTGPTWTSYPLPSTPAFVRARCAARSSAFTCASRALSSLDGSPLGAGARAWTGAAAGAAFTMGATLGADETATGAPPLNPSSQRAMITAMRGTPRRAASASRRATIAVGNFTLTGVRSPLPAISEPFSPCTRQAVRSDRVHAFRRTVYTLPDTRSPAAPRSLSFRRRGFPSRARPCPTTACACWLVRGAGDGFALSGAGRGCAGVFGLVCEAWSTRWERCAPACVTSQARAHPLAFHLNPAPPCAPLGDLDR